MSLTARRTGSWALWLHLRARPNATQPLPQVTPPAGDGPLCVIHLPKRAEETIALNPLVRALRRATPKLRIILSGPSPDTDPNAADRNLSWTPTPTDLPTASSLIDQLRPDTLLLVGGDLPAALVAAASEAGCAVILAEARLTPASTNGYWQGAVTRGLMSRMDRVLAPDLASLTEAVRLGTPRDRVEMVGPITETLPPLSVNDAERRALSQIMRGRHVWMAAAPTMPEIDAILAAHHAALQHNHRALLILADLDETLVPDLMAKIEASGLAAISRSEDYDPGPDDQVLVASDPYEMGLWYQLAPVCFMGGTLIAGHGQPPRHPFEPAALGSAIIHGPLTTAFAAEWAQLDGAAAARPISETDDLARAAADLSAPDQAALLAGNAWSVSTGGAAALHRIAEVVAHVSTAKP